MFRTELVVATSRDTLPPAGIFVAFDAVTDGFPVAGRVSQAALRQLSYDEWIAMLLDRIRSRRSLAELIKVQKLRARTAIWKALGFYDVRFVTMSKDARARDREAIRAKADGFLALLQLMPLTPALKLVASTQSQEERQALTAALAEGPKA